MTVIESRIRVVRRGLGVRSKLGRSVASHRCRPRRLHGDRHRRHGGGAVFEGERVGDQVALAIGGRRDALRDIQRRHEWPVGGQNADRTPAGVGGVQADGDGGRGAVGQGVAGRQLLVGIVHHDDELAIRQIGKSVGPIHVGLRRAVEQFSRVVNAIAVGVVVQGDGDARDASLPGIFNRIIVIVLPNQIANGVGAGQQSSHRVIGEAAGEAKLDDSGVVNAAGRIAAGHGRLKAHRYSGGWCQRAATERPADPCDGGRRWLGGDPGGPTIRGPRDGERAPSRDGVRRGGRSGHVGQPAWDRILQDEGHPQIRVAHALGPGIQCRQRVGYGTTGGDGRGAGLVEGHLRRRRGHGDRPGTVVAVEFLVIVAGGHFLIRGDRERATGAQGQELVIDQADGSNVVLRQILEVGLVFKGNEHFRPRVQLDDDDAVAFDKADTQRIEKRRISHRLQPGVPIRHAVPVVVEARPDIAQVEPDALGADGSRDTG